MLCETLEGDGEMDYLVTPAPELMSRIKKLQVKLLENNLDGVLLTKNVEIYYYSGTMQNSLLFIPDNGEPILFVKKSVERAREETPFAVEPMTSMKHLPDQIVGKGYNLAKLGTELDVLPYNQFMRLQKVFANSTFTDISWITRLQRSVKSPHEIELLRNTARVLDQAFAEVPNILKVGMREVDLSSAIEKLIRDLGHSGYMRTRAYNMELVLGMVASGEMAARATSFDGPAGGQGLSPAMPQSAGFKQIERNEPIIIDIGAMVNGYIVDQTRIAVIGQLDKELENAYQVSLKIINETMKNAKSGTLWSEHYRNALRIVEEAGLQEHFMGYKHDQAK